MPDSVNILPDAPFRNGASGKYKLLIKSVTQKFRDYEYELTDSEGKEYTAVSKVHYPVNAILHCMITFKIEQAILIVSETTICSKQDFAKPVTDKRPTITATVEKSPAVEAKPIKKKKKKKKNSASSTIITPKVHVSPSVIASSGLHRLTVYASQNWNNEGNPMFLYRLHDDLNQEFYAISNATYQPNEVALCRVEVLNTKKEHIFFSSFFRDLSSKPIGMVNGEIILRQLYFASNTPSKIPITQLEPKAKKTRPAQNMAPLLGKYKKGERYDFVVTNKCDESGNQILKDSSGRLHILRADARYQKGDKVRCTVMEFESTPVSFISGSYLVLSKPCIIKTESVRGRYSKRPEAWYNEVQGLGKHKCGKPFICSCCGLDFPANAGWRVDLKEIYFCNSCAKLIYEPGKRGNKRFYIMTPMGNKR